jgi:predicted nucleic acid-binding protein
MPDVVIADTTCFIILSNINELNLLKSVYGEITTTPEVAKEFGEKLPDWIKVRSCVDNQKQQILSLQVDKGEASAIALALEIPNSVIILDDLQARRLAEQLGSSVTGTLGIIVKAKLDGIIPSVKPIIDQIKQTNFRISKALEELVFKQAKE